MLQILSLCIICLLGAETGSTAAAHTLKPFTQHEEFKEFSFEGKAPTKYGFEGNALTAEVRHSASAMYQAFTKLKVVSAVRFEWRSNHRILKKSPKYEESKSGDDYLLRVGLTESGPAPMVPFFAPSWVKKLEALSKLPGHKITYLVVDAKHAIGQRWKSPYSSDIEMIAVRSIAKDKGWQEVRYEFSSPLSVVGLWIMSDGDDTETSFTTTLRNLELIGPER